MRVIGFHLILIAISVRVLDQLISRIWCTYTISRKDIVHHSDSLVSRPSQTLFVDHLQYAKPEHSVFA